MKKNQSVQYEKRLQVTVENKLALTIQQTDRKTVFLKSSRKSNPTVLDKHVQNGFKACIQNEEIRHKCFQGTLTKSLHTRIIVNSFLFSVFCWID